MKCLVMGVLLFTGTVVLAQQEGVPIGSFTLFPSIGVSIGYGSNITRDDNNEVDSLVTVISPGFRLVKSGEKSEFLFQYDYEKTMYDDASENDFDSHHVLVDYSHRVSSRTNFGVSAEYHDSADRRGTGTQQGPVLDLGLAPDEWHSFGLGANLHYGGVGAKGSLDFEAGTLDRTYDNNRELTIFRDREVNYFGVTYGHQIRPKTRLMLHAKRTDIDFDVADLDSTELRLMLGAEWQVTGKTETRFLVGHLEKDFDSPARDDFSGLAWELGMTWQPRSHSIVDLSTSRETDETNNDGSFVLRRNVDLGWTHYWGGSRFNTTASVGFSKEDYREDVRDDDIDYFGLSAKYQFRKWLLFGLGYQKYQRDSNVSVYDYDDDLILLTIEASR